MTPSEKRQRAHELAEAYKAAKRLEERLEMAAIDPRAARRIREQMAAELILLGIPMADFGA